MNASRAVLGVVVALPLLLCRPGGAQKPAPNKPEPGAAPAEVTLAPREIDEIAKLLADLEKARKRADIKGLKNFKKTMDQLQALFERLRKENRDPLKAVKSWWQVFSSEKYTRYRGRSGRQSNKKHRRLWMGKVDIVVYQLHVPATYRSRTAAPVVLCLHPKAGKFSGSEYLRHMWSTKELKSGPILLAPELPAEPADAAWSQRKLLYASIGLLGDVVLRDYNVDRNRLFLDGYADGAVEAWKIAAALADNFAGVIIRGAMPPEGTRFQDFVNTAFLLVGAPGMDLDPAKADALAATMRKAGVDVTVAKLSEAPRPRRERDAFKNIAGDVLAFLQKSRNPYPEKIDWSVKENYTRRCFYIKSTNELEDQAVSAVDRATPPNYRVTLDRSHNRLVIQSHRILGFQIELNDLLLDLDKPVTFEVNGKVLYNGTPERSFRTLQDSVERSGDWTRVYPWAETIHVPAPAKGATGAEQKAAARPDQPEANGKKK